MGVLSRFLFGSEPKVNVSNKSKLSPEQQQIMSQLGNFFESQFSGIQDGSVTAPQFGGDLATQLDPSQTASLQGLTDIANQIATGQSGFDDSEAALQNAGSGPSAMDLFSGGDFSQFTGEASDSLGSAGSFSKQIFNDSGADFNDFFNIGIRDPLLESFQDTILPGISRSQGPTGFFSGDRIRQDELAQKNLLGHLTRSRSELAFNADQARLDRRATAAQSLDTFADAGLGRDFASMQEALDRAFGADSAQEETGRALAISDADRSASTDLTRALGLADIETARTGALSGIVNAGEVGRRAEAENVLLEYSDFLRTSGFEDAQIQTLIQFLGIGANENIVKNIPGTVGYYPALAASFASGLGGSLGSAAGGGD